MKSLAKCFNKKSTILLLLVGLFITSCSQENGRDNELMQVEAYVDIAEVYRDQGQFRSAIIELQNALAISPEHERAMIAYARTNLDIGRFDESLRVLTSLTERPEANFEEDITLLLAEAHLIAGDLESAIEVIETHEFSDQSQENKAFWIIGSVLSLQGDLSAAEASFRTILSNDTNYVNAITGLSRIAYANGEIEESRALLDQASTVEPESIDVSIWRGVFSTLQAEYPEAEQAFKQALETMSSWDIMTAKRFSVLQALLVPLQMQQKNDEALQYSQIIDSTPQGQFQNNFLSALSFFEQGNFSRALETIQNQIANAPNSPELNVLLGLTNYALGDYASATEVLENFSADIDASSHPLRILAASHIQLGNMSQALTVLNEAETRFPEDAAVIALIGAVQQNAGNLSEAISAFERALDIEPESPEILTAQAISYYQQGQYDNAEQQLDKAIEFGPDYDAAKEALVAVYLEQNRAEEAMQRIADWERENSNSTFISNLAGRVALQQNDFETAQRVFAANARNDSSNLTSSLMLLRASIAAGDMTQANSTIDSILERDPTNFDALSQLLLMGVLTDSEAESISRVETVIDDYPDAYFPSLALAQFQIQKGDLQSALEYADLSYEKNQNQLTENILIGVLIRQVFAGIEGQDFDNASISIERALQLQANNIRVLAAAAQLSGRLNQYDIAQGYVEQIRTILPDSSLSYEVEGDMLFGANDVEAILAAYRNGWNTDQSPTVASKLFGVLSANGRNNEASAFLEEWIAATPEDGNANMFMAMDHQQQNRDDQAIDHYEVAYESLPNNMIILNNLAWLYQDSEPARALELASRANDLFPQSPDVLDTYGWILLKQNRIDEAVAVLRQAQALAPESELISEHLESALQ